MGHGEGVSGSGAEVQTTPHSEGKPTVNAFWGLNCDGHAFVPSQFFSINPLGFVFFSFLNIAVRAWVAGRKPSAHACYLLFCGQCISEPDEGDCVTAGCSSHVFAAATCSDFLLT